ncbi:MAG: vitamin B12 dependent-methionine synthase activation domain-containing protein [Longimicrobiales bacterium]|nr:vitamin B12 dependent-methionine synthase activation domain-containing protein [Longimicrobiales bacterium]
MILEIGVAEVVPDAAAVLAALDVPADRAARPHLEDLVASALRAFEDTAAPVGIVADLSREAFAEVYSGAPANAPDSVVADVYPRAEALSLFVVTLGSATSDAIARGFAARDFALAATLDAVASEAADRAAEVVERRVERRLRDAGRLGDDAAALRYSPGYCGWDVGGQAALFRHLKPGRIGVRLTDGGFMTPEKSVSGVILAGPRQIHRFSPTYSFCASCATHSCRERMAALFGREARRSPDGSA